MFCPLGYVPFEEFNKLCYETRDDIMPPEGFFTRPDGFEDSRAYFYAREMLLAWLLFRLLRCEEFPKFLCSPDGRVMRATWHFFHGSDQFLHGAEWNLPFDNVRDHKLDLQLNRAMAIDPFYHLNCLYFFDPWTGTISMPMEKIETVLQRGEMNEEDLADMVNVAQQFHGWAVCFRDQGFPEDSDDIISLLGTDPKTIWGEGTNISGGRPRKQGDALIAYESSFPNGHNGMTWKEVAQSIQNETGQVYHPRTIQRALSDKTTDNSD